MAAFDYIKETQAELRHVAWPTRTQTIVYTGLVIGISLVVALYLGFFDYLFTSTLARVIGVETAAPQQTEVTPNASSSAATSAPIDFGLPGSSQ